MPADTDDNQKTGQSGGSEAARGAASAADLDPAEMQRLAEAYERKRQAARDRKRLSRARNRERVEANIRDAVAAKTAAEVLLNARASQTDSVTVTGHIKDDTTADELETRDLILPPNPGGRPTVWTAEKAHEWQEKLLRWIEQGQSVASFVRNNPDGPSLATWALWKRIGFTPYPIFAQAFVRAREDGADYLAESVIEIADSVKDADREDMARVQAARLRIDSRKWVASKLKPREYADRVENFHEHNHSVNATVTITDDDRAAFLASVLKRQALNDAQSLPDAMRLIEGQAKDVTPQSGQSGEKPTKTDA